MEIDFMVKDAFAQIRPGYVMAKSSEQATKAFAEAVTQNYKASENEKAIDLDMEEETMSPDEGAEDELPVPEVEDGESSSEEIETEVCPDPT